MQGVGPVIVAFDGSRGAADALALGRLLSSPLDVSVVVARVQAGGGAEPPGAPSELVVVPGRSVDRALHRLAAETGASAIVVGSSRRGRAGRVLPGGTGERLLHRAPCAVALAPLGFADTDPRLEAIGCAFDGGAEASAALRAAERLAGAAAARLEVIACTEPVVYASRSGYEYEVVMAAERDRCRDLLAGAVRDLSIPAVPILLDGFAGAAIAARSARLDLLVCGSRGYRPTRAAIAGGVSGHLFRHAACPVLALPRGARDTLERGAGREPAGVHG
jgi:nucleotide-binding universal stress UspA family protein